jgi:hypothetical protein
MILLNWLLGSEILEGSVATNVPKKIKIEDSLVKV